MTYPEVHSLEESLAILDKYKNELNKEQYNSINSTIHNFAIESMYANERDILNMIRVQKREITADEIISQYKKEWGVL